MKTYLFHVNGTHCKACKVLIEDVLGQEKDVQEVKVDLNKQTVEIKSATKKTAEASLKHWAGLLKPYKYELSSLPTASKKDLKSAAYALPLGLLILGLFLLLQRSGWIDFGFEGGLTPWTALLIGGIASVSSCLAVVGGLVLSLSATLSKEASTTKPFIFFHTGRILGFALLGGLLGQLGSLVSINNTVASILGILAALVMIILGLNLIDIFQGTKRLEVALPRHFFDKIIRFEKGFFGPFIVGIATFFLPCGFTQSMQVAALSSGSFMSGASIMTFFVLGTFPMLALLSFGSLQCSQTRFAPLFFKTAGVVVIGLGTISLLAALAGLGILTPLFNF